MKPLYAVSLILLVFLSSLVPIQAQELFRNYTSLVYNENLTKNDKQTLKAIAKQEKEIAKFMRFGDFQLRTVPIVFHILYANEAQRITLEQVEYL